MHPLDAMTAAPDHHKVLLENDSVRVLDTCVGPGQQTPVHAHEWPAALYVLSWSDFVRCDPDGNVLRDSRTTFSTTPRPGETIWGEALSPHTIRNVGQTDLHIIVIEVKS